MSLTTLLFDKRTAVLAIQICGVTFVLANAYLVMLMVGYLRGDPSADKSRRLTLLRIIAFLCALSYYPLLYWSLMGMETGLLTLLLSASILCAFEYTKDPKLPQALLLSIFLGLSYLARPDSIIFSVLIFTYFFFEARRSKRSLKLPTISAIVGLYALFVIGQEVFRWSYYGELLPNTYTLKLTGMPMATRIKNGIGFMTPFLLTGIPVWLVVGAGLAFNFKTEKLLVITLFVASICYQIWIGGEAWRYWRMMSPLMPLILVWLAQEILVFREIVATPVTSKSDFAASRFLSNHYVFNVLNCLTPVLMFGSLVLLNKPFLPEITFHDRPYQVTENEWAVNKAIALNHLTTRDATVGVFWAGSIPYYTGRYAIDFLGKSDRHIARLPPDLSGSIAWNGMTSVPGHNKYDLQYSIVSLEPTYVQGFRWGKQDILAWAGSRYEMVKVRGAILFLRKDSKAVLWDRTRFATKKHPSLRGRSAF
jgi:hypothetical protein